MKLLLSRLAVVAAVPVLAISCMVTSVPQRLDRFVDNAELKSSSYSSADWEKSVSEYDKLAEKFASTEQDYSQEEQQMAARAMGRYHSLLLKNGIQQSEDYLEKLKDELPAYIDGLAEGLGKRAEDIEKTLEKILSDKKLEKSLENLGEQIQKIASDEKLGKAIEDFGKKLEGLLENKELEKSLEDLGKRLEDLFGSFSGEEPAQEEMK